MLTRKFYSILLLFLFMVGCNNPESNPEIRDPIYNDYRAEEDHIGKDIEAKQKELDEIQEQQASLADNDYQKKLNRDEIFRLGNVIEKLKQKKEFFTISAESRQIFARKQYLEYFQKGKEWPPPGLKEKYFEAKDLESAPKRWSRGTASLKPKKEEKKEGSHEDGEASEHH